MKGPKQESTDQVELALTALKTVLGDSLLAVYLHGSAVSGVLRPQSDLDLLAVINDDMTDGERTALLNALLRISGRHPAKPGGPRCVEVMVFRAFDLVEGCFPARAEFIYGEWLRESFEAGEILLPTSDPESTLVLAQAHQEAALLFANGSAKDILPEVPIKDIRQAMRDLLPGLLDGLQGDERNILLTLARMWFTASTGDFVTKDAAATWATLQINHPLGATLEYARQAYLGEITDDWQDRGDCAQKLAQHLKNLITPLL